MSESGYGARAKLMAHTEEILLRVFPQSSKGRVPPDQLKIAMRLSGELGLHGQGMSEKPLNPLKP